MIRFQHGQFVLTTESTTYCFRVLASGHLEHGHYGEKIDFQDLDQSSIDAIYQKTAFLPGNTIAYDSSIPHLGLESLGQEISSLGKGDIRDPFVVVKHKDGSRTCDFLYVSHEIVEGKNPLVTLPSAYGEPRDVMTLEVLLRDASRDLELTLSYHVFATSDVITRTSRLKNIGKDEVCVERLMSLQIDFDHHDFLMTTFNGRWSNEMTKNTHTLHAGRHVNESIAGVSSSRANPFFMVHDPSCHEDHGQVYGFNLVYSGNHYGACEVGTFGGLRVMSGLHPMGFEWVLEEGQVLESPEAVMTFSAHGFTHMSHQMHHFVKNHIVRGEWQHKVRPVLLNSWEASYFDFNQSSLLKLAKKAQAVGIELFVLDDGWFGERDDDTSSLGDWYVHSKKLPQGLGGLSEAIQAMGMSFGIWVEPEMVSEKSRCYQAHPEWAVRLPQHPHALGRHQMLLDLSQKPVQDYLIASMTEVFQSGQVSYVKWDMNRIFSDQYSQVLAPKHQGEFLHRYVIGLYHVLDVLTKRFPGILFEGCASGGNRFDLGMLCYMPQIWASDNTDAISRLKIQEGYTYAYPLSVMGAHVSDCPNHQTLRHTPLKTRFNVASFGLLGYECNLVDFSPGDLEAIKRQIALYKKWRKLLQFGDFYRLTQKHHPQITQWLVVADDKSHALAGVFQKSVEANALPLKLKLKGLNPQKLYHIYNQPHKHTIKLFGDLINTVSPIHIKKDSMLHHLVAKLKPLPGEVASYRVTGTMLMAAGLTLNQSYTGVGLSPDIRVFEDYASRLYFIEGGA